MCSKRRWMVVASSEDVLPIWDLSTARTYLQELFTSGLGPITILLKHHRLIH